MTDRGCPPDDYLAMTKLCAKIVANRIREADDPRAAHAAELRAILAAAPTWDVPGDLMRSLMLRIYKRAMQRALSDRL